MSDPTAAGRDGGTRQPLALEQDRLLACVHCGFCLNACPTYTRLGDESDSPRGRLYLMRAVVEGRLEPDDDAFRVHIDRCLGCRACEPVCPSGVQYGFVLERARATIARNTGIPAMARALLATVASPVLNAFVFGSGRVLRGIGLAGVLARAVPARFGRMRMALAMLAASSPWRGLRAAANGRAAPVAAGPDDVAAPAAGQNREVADPHARAAGLRAGTSVGPDAPPRESRPRVAVLRGCVQRGLFARVNDATERVLRANGCEVVDVPGQHCCGALHAHAGDLDGALRLARANIEAFEAAGADWVIVNAAGCGAIMKEYGEQFERDAAIHERAEAFSSRVRDLSEFLAGHGVRRGAPVPLRVTYDAPCHLIHAQRIASAPLDVLGAVPDLEIVPLPGAEECCGGAGIYGMQHPELGGRIVKDKTDAIRATGARVVLTPNPGCMMQIGASLVLAGDDVRVLHPVEILDESYRRQGDGSG